MSDYLAQLQYIGRSGMEMKILCIHGIDEVLDRSHRS